MITVEEAKKLIKSQAIKFGTEVLPLEKGFGRVLAEEVRADRDYPPFNRSAMDGYAVRSAGFGKYEQLKVASSVFAGDFSDADFGEGEVVKIMTGAPVPAAFDAVVRLEDAEQQGEYVRFSLNAVEPGQNMALQGEDLRKGEGALAVGTLIGPAEVTLLASLGKAEVDVYQPPRVVIISTGNEVRPVFEKVLPYQIRDSNSHTLVAFFKQMQIENVERYLVGDSPDLLKVTLEKAMGADIIILSGGVSMGEADYVPAVLKGLGVVNVFHKLKLKPGKPLWFGRKEGGPVVFGLPGNPFSCQVTFKLFIQSFLRECFGMGPLKPLFLKADFDRSKKGEMEEYFPCTLVVKEGETVLKACSFNGSGDVTATAMSDGLACHPLDTFDIKKGDVLAFYLWR